MNSEFYLVIGSNNPVKIEATKLGFKFLFPDKSLKIFNYKVDSGVDDQPIGIENIIAGAINRIKNAKHNFSKEYSNINEDQIYYVGIESGISKIDVVMSKYLDFQFAAICHNNIITLGCGSAFEYPKFVIEKILSGEENEIGNLFEKLSQQQNIKYKQGAIGFLSSGKLNRVDILKNAIIMALIPYFRKDLYFKDYKNF